MSPMCPTQSMTVQQNMVMTTRFGRKTHLCPEAQLLSTTQSSLLFS
uniref:Uncharacterized protein n=1 Tax=Anguilla anguilla TaxID=7936 RepID=A0A0E9VEY7_ANGAN